MLWAQSCSTEGAVAPCCCLPRGCRAGGGFPCTHCQLMESPTDVSMLSSWAIPRGELKRAGDRRGSVLELLKRGMKSFFLTPPPPPCCGFGICIYLLVLFLAGMNPLFGAGIPSPIHAVPSASKQTLLACSDFTSRTFEAIGSGRGDVCKNNAFVAVCGVCSLPSGCPGALNRWFL